MPQQGALPPKLEGMVLRYYNNYVYIASGQASNSQDPYDFTGFFRYNLNNNT